MRADILFIACIFPRPFGAPKNTTQLAKYPRVLYAKPSNKVYVFNKDRTEFGLCCLRVFFRLCIALYFFFESVFTPFSFFGFCYHLRFVLLFLLCFSYGVRTRVLQEHQLTFLVNSVSITVRLLEPGTLNKIYQSQC